MSGPSQRAAERRAARRGAATSPGRTSRSRVRAAAASVRERPTLTGRAVILAVVLGMLVLTLVVPLRELVAQRAEINALQAQNDAAASRVDQLEAQKRRLQDPTYIQSLIRSRLHYVMPGEVGYVVLDPDEAPAPEKAAAAAAPGAWYDKLWQAVEDADTAGSGAAAAPAAASR
ncbi:MAG: septum formation initiator family protein [Candidatus Nanopelagicales bacterium]